MNFYLRSAVMIQGLHREELREFFLEEAASEMEHVKEFSDLILGLGGIPPSASAFFPDHFTSPKDILTYALTMEEEVVSNYVERIEQAEKFGGVDGKWIVVFLEEQLMKSRKDIDNFKQMLHRVQ